MDRRPNFGSSHTPARSFAGLQSLDDDGVAYWTSRWIGYAALLAGFAIAAIFLI